MMSTPWRYLLNHLVRPLVQIVSPSQGREPRINVRGMNGGSKIVLVRPGFRLDSYKRSRLGAVHLFQKPHRHRHVGACVLSVLPDALYMDTDCTGGGRKLQGTWIAG